MSKKLIFKYTKLALKVLIYLGVLYFISEKIFTNFNDVQDQLKEMNYLYLLCAVLLYMLHTYWNALNWNYMMLASKEDVKLLDQIGVYLKSYVLRYIPGNVVGIMSRGVYNKEYGVNITKSLWGWFLENLIYLLIAVILGYFAFITAMDIPDLSAKLLPDQFGNPNLAIYFFPVMVFLGFALILFDGFLQFIFNILVEKAVPKKYNAKFESLKLDFVDRIILIVRYAFSWLIYSVSFIFVVYSVTGYTGDPIILASVNALAWSVGYMAIVTPSGLGVREFVMTTALTSATIGIEPEIAALITALARLVFITGELLSFVPYWIAVKIKNG